MRKVVGMKGLDEAGESHSRVVCIDGPDLYDKLDRERPLNFVIERKVRRAAVTWLPFERIHDLCSR